MSKTLEHERRLYLNALMMIKEQWEQRSKYDNALDELLDLRAIIKRELEICELIKTTSEENE